MWSTPSATASRRIAIAALRSSGGPNTFGPVSRMAPKPIGETTWAPSGRRSIRVSIGSVTAGAGFSSRSVDLHRLVEREPADPLAGQGRDRVRQCRRAGRHTDLTDTGRRLVGFEQVHLDHGDRLHAHDGVAIEVLGEDVTTFAEHDLAPGGGTDPEQQAALDLRPDQIGIDGDAAVEDVDDAIDVDTIAVVERHFGHLRAVTQEAAAGDASGVPL